MSKIIADESTIKLEQQTKLLKLLETATDFVCENCGGLNFIDVYRIKKISGLATGTGVDSLLPIPVYACADCGHVNSIFIEKMNNKKEETQKIDSQLNLF